jgi:hypothetical protein
MVIHLIVGVTSPREDGKMPIGMSAASGTEKRTRVIAATPNMGYYNPLYGGIYLISKN